MDPLLDNSNDASDFSSSVYLELINEASQLDIDGHIQRNAVFAFQANNMETGKCLSVKQHKDLQKLNADEQMRIAALHAVIKACDVARVPVMMWDTTLDDWRQHCLVTKKRKTVHVMVPFDHIVSLDHLSLLYVRWLPIATILLFHISRVFKIVMLNNIDRLVDFAVIVALIASILF